MAAAHGTNVAQLACGVFLLLWGVASLVVAATDYRHWISQMYENNKNRKTGFGAISKSPSTYRMFIGLSGAFAVLLGVGFVALS